MKKIISLVLTLAMLVCCINVSAAVDALYQALTTQYLTGITETEYSLSLNRPLTFLKQIDQQLGPIKPVDVQQLAESVFDIKEKATTVSSVSEDYSKIQLSLESEVNLPLEFNDNLKAEVWAQVGVWADMNLTDVNKPVYNIILKIPFSDKYLVLDYGDLLDSGFDTDTIKAVMEKATSAEYNAELNEYLAELLRSNFTVKEQRAGREYLITADDRAIKAVVGGIVDKSVEMAESVMGDSAAEVFDEEFYTQLDELGEKLNNIPIFGKDGIKMKVVVNGKKLVRLDADINVCVNIYDVMQAFEQDVVQYNRDEWYVDFTLSFKTSASKLGEAVSVKYPQLDDTNSTGLTEVGGMAGAYTAPLRIYTRYDIQPDSAGSFMMPLRDCLASLDVNVDEYTIADGNVDIVPSDEESTVATTHMEVGSNKIMVNGIEKSISQRVTTDVDGIVLVPADAVGYMTSSTISYVSVDMDGSFPNRVHYELTEADVLPDLDALVDFESYYQPEGEEAEDDYVYVSSVINVTIDGMPYITNDTVYLPVEAFMSRFAPESITRDGKVVTITAPAEHPKEFGRIEFTADSKTVVIDGVQHTMTKPVMVKDGVEYMPAEFLTLINCEPGNIQYFFGNNYRIVVHRNMYANVYSYETMFPDKTLNVMVNEPLVVGDGGYYLPLRPLMGEFKVRDENITVDGTRVAVTSDAPATGFEKLVIDGTKVVVDGTEYTIQYPVKNVNGTTYVPQQLVTDVLGGEITDVGVNYGEFSTTHYTVKVANPLYVPDEE